MVGSAADPELAFGPFRLDPLQRRLVMSGETGEQAVPLGSRALDLLTMLARRHGQLLTKAELFEAVWPGLALEDSNLTVQISAIRKALGGVKTADRWIETVQGRATASSELSRRFLALSLG